MTADEQRLLYADSIGTGVDRTIIEDVRTFASSAQTHDRFLQYAEIRFVYEMLVMEGGRDKVLALVDSWVNVWEPHRLFTRRNTHSYFLQNEANVQRAARHVQREPAFQGQALVRAFCIFRLKRFDGRQWEFLDDHGVYTDDHLPEGQSPQTVVFVALTELNRHNGFFIDLKEGEDVCIDSGAVLQFPPEGGGLGVCLCLNL